MSTKSYEDQMFDFFTQPENFETMLKVVGQVDAIKVRLVQEFWYEVMSELRNKLGSGWIVRFSDNWQFKYNKVLIYSQGWHQDPNYPLPLSCIGFENIRQDNQPILGIFIGFGSHILNGDQLKSEFLNSDIYKKNLIEFKTDGNNHWAFWKHMPLKFYEADSLGKILPENRKVEIDNFVAEGLRLIELVRDQINGLIIKNSRT